MSESCSGPELLDLLAQEFVERFRQGERPTLAEYTNRHPELAKEIQDLFPALVVIEQFGSVDGPPADSQAHPTKDGSIPEQLGEYRILREVARGGMGIVYEAVQESLGRHVALKVLPFHTRLHGNQLERFRREARSAAQLHHTNIVPVFGVGEHDGVAYYAMQFIQGQTLEHVLEELRQIRPVQNGERRSVPRQSNKTRPQPVLGAVIAESLMTGEFAVPEAAHQFQTESSEPLRKSNGQALASASAPTSNRSPMSRGHAASSADVGTRSEWTDQPDREYFRSVARVGMQVAEALAYAHQQGILHRDIKPSNLLLDSWGTVWVTDFGLAKAEGSDELTSPGDIIGTLRYMAPERFSGVSQPRSDVYSLGLTLYEMLTLQPGFSDTDRGRLIRRITEETPTHPCRVVPTIPRDLETIVLKAIEKDATRRYGTAQAMADDLRHFLADEPVKARRVGLFERWWRWCRRNRTVASLAAAVLFLITTLAIVSSIGAIWLGAALSDSKTNLLVAERANTEGEAKLWESLVSQARATRMTRQPGQRFDTLATIREAMELPVPPGHSVDELRTEAIAALLLPDLEVAKELDGWPIGSSGFALDSAFERYARGDKDGTVSVRRTADDVELFSLPGTGELTEYGGIVFSPDSRFLILTTSDHRTVLWRIDGPVPVQVLQDDHRSLCFRPDGRELAVDYPDGTMRIFESETLQELRHWDSPAGPTRSGLLWNPKLPQLMISNGGGTWICDVETGALLWKVPQTDCWWFDWHPEGRLLALSDGDRRIRIWDVVTRQLAVPPLEGHQNSGIVLGFNHAGDRLVSNDWSGILRVWDVRSGRQILTQPANGAVLQFSSDDGLLAADLASPKIRLFRARSGEEFLTVNPPADSKGKYRARQPTNSSKVNGMTAVATYPDHTTALIDLERNVEVARLSLECFPIRFESDGSALWTASLNGLLLWPIHRVSDDGNHWRVGPPRRIADFANRAAIGASADGQIVAVPNYNLGSFLWHRATNRVFRLQPQTDVRCCDVSPDGRWVATGTHSMLDGQGTKVWDAQTGTCVADFQGECSSIVRFSPNEKWLVTSGTGPRIWEVGTWREGPALGGSVHNRHFAFSADSKLLALGDAAQGVVRLVVPETGTELAHIIAPEPTRLHPISFSEDGSRLFTIGEESGAVHVFDLRAIRLQLQELGLDWDAPPLPAPPEPSRAPLQVEVDLGDFKQRLEADRLANESTRFMNSNEPAKAIEALRQAVQVCPNHELALNNLAWHLVAGPKELRDPTEALPLARKAVEVSTNPLYANTLGVALYRAGEYKEAISFLGRSLAEGKGDSDAYDLLFLAMCHHGLNDTARARECYDRAMQWLRDHRGKIPATWARELAEFQAEAEALLLQAQKNDTSPR